MLKHIAALLILATLLALPIAAMTLSPHFQYCENHSGEYPSETTNHNPTTSGIKDTKSRTVLLGCISGFTNENAGAITAWATILLTLVTYGLVLVAFEQFRTTRAQLRAYLLPTDKCFRRPIIVGTEPRAFFYFTNFGQTPGYKVRCWGDICVADFPLPKGTVLPKVEFDGKQTETTAGPNVILEMPDKMASTLTQAQFDGIANNSKALYVYGRIEYVDAFGKDRFTNFRFCANAANGPLDKLGGLAHCGEGNEAD